MRKLRLRAADKLPKPIRESVAEQGFELSSFPFKVWKDKANGSDDTPRVLGKSGALVAWPQPTLPLHSFQGPKCPSWPSGAGAGQRRQKGTDFCLQGGGWGTERWEGEGGGPRHTSQFSGGSPGWQDEKAWLGFRTLGGRRPGPPGSDPRRRQASPPTFFRCLSRPPFTYQGKKEIGGKGETPLAPHCPQN